MKAWLAVPAACFLACGQFGPHRDPEEPPASIGRRLFRGSLDDHLRVFFFEASDTALTLAYDTSLCGLLAAWKGPVIGPARNPEGTYAAQGPVYQRQPAASLWTIRNGEDTLAAAVRWLGLSEDSTGYVQFRYALILPSGDTIKVTEEPSWDNHYGDNALQRDYRFTGIPFGAIVSLRLGATPGKYKELWSQSADGAMAGAGLDRRLDLTADGIANVKVLWEGSAAL